MGKLKPNLRFNDDTSNYKVNTLIELVKIIGGATPLKSNKAYWENGTVPWLSSQEIGDRLISKGTYEISELAIAEKTTRMVDENTILMVTRSGILARKVPISITDNKLAINQDIKALISNSALLLPNYLYYWLKKHEFLLLTKIVKTGTTVQSISLPDLEKMDVHYPSLTVQQKIVDFFTLLDMRIEKQQEKMHAWREYKKGVMQKFFNQELHFKDVTGRVFPKWKSMHFKDVVQELIGGGTPSRSQEEYYNGTIPWVTVKDLKANKYIADAQEYITVLGLQNSSAKIVQSGDLIIPTRMAVGRILIAKADVAINQDLKGCSLKPEYDTEFIYYLYLSMSSFIERLGSGSTVSGININDLLNIKISVPVLDEQIRIANYLKVIDSKIELESEKLKVLELQKQSLMQQMFI